MPDLILMSIIGGIVFVLTFRERKSRPFWFSISCIVLVVAACRFLFVALGPPGREQTDIVDPDDDHEYVPLSVVEQLQLEWDSERRQADWPVVETLAELSNTAYLAPVDAAKRFEDLGFSVSETITDASMIGYVVSEGDVTVIAFRGTDFGEASDWIKNLSVASTSTAHGPIHSGFNRAYLSLKPQIDRILSRDDPEYLWITGHSLGGAMAVVCAYDLRQTRRIAGLITFGQPMVARPPLAGYIDRILGGRYARFVIGRDLVPRLPPPTYTYCGSLVWLIDGEIRRSNPRQMTYGASPHEFQLDDGTEFDPQLSEADLRRLQADLQAQDAEPERLPDGTPVYGGNSPLIKDHSMSVYVEQIRDHLGTRVFRSRLLDISERDD